MARSAWKGCYFSKTIISSLIKINFFKSNRLVVYSRSSAIPKLYSHIVCGVDKGMSLRHVYIRPLYVGHKFGEFAFSRKNYHFPPKDNKSKLRR